MNGTSISGIGNPGSVGLDWTIQGVGDFNGDGKADILWRHTSGLVGIWLMNGTSIVGMGSGQRRAGPDDPRGRGLQRGRQGRHPVAAHSGLVDIWLMNGTAISSIGNLSTVGLDWSIQ